MISQIRPKLLLLSLVFCLALLPVSQGIATEMGSMDTMTEFCPGCDLDNKENTCDVGNSCINSVTAYETAIITVNQTHLIARLISDHENHGGLLFQSQPPGSLYRPPIA